ncbi:MAG: helix-turn-helix domain-containing protein [Halobacteriaceae archaeon]
MANAERVSSTDTPSSTRLTLEIWHPNCWTLKVTKRVDAGLISHGVYKIGTEVRARVTAHADTAETLDILERDIESSPLTNTVTEINEYFEPHTNYEAAGNATRELLVEYPAHNSIHDEIVSRGFVPDDPIRVRDGKEYWTVICEQSRDEIQRKLDRIRSAMNAEITIESIKTPSNPSGKNSSRQKLSERQRQVFELAQQEGYYSWPREVSVTELAEKADISKATFLEHLRKAEAKLLGPES